MTEPSCRLPSVEQPGAAGPRHPPVAPADTPAARCADHRAGRTMDPMPTSPPALTVTGLRKSYRDVDVLHDVSFDVEHGEIFGLLGSNGAGKTTAVETIQGLRRRDAGTISLFGLDPVIDADEIRHRHLVGAQLQSSALPDRIKVGEALRLFAALAGNLVDWRELRDRWELGPLERRAFGALSGGQRQRLFLALALVNQPRLVFLDELTQGLDAAARRQTWDLIEEVRDAGTTMVLVTHFMDEAERLCDRVGVLHDGRLAYEGRPADLVTAVGGPTHIRFRLDEPFRLDGIERVPGVVGAHVLHGQAEVRCHAAACVPVIAELFGRGLTPGRSRRPAPDPRGRLRGAHEHRPPRSAPCRLRPARSSKA